MPVAAYEPESIVMDVEIGADGIESSRYLHAISQHRDGRDASNYALSITVEPCAITTHIASCPFEAAALTSHHALKTKTHVDAAARAVCEAVSIGTRGGGRIRWSFRAR